MSKTQYFQIYLFWVKWVSIRSVLAAVFISLFCATLVYISKGFPSLSSDILSAILDIFYFCFPIAFSFSFIISFLVVFKALFKHKFIDFKIELHDCKDSIVKDITLSDVTSLWRRWLFITFWLIVIFLVIILGAHRLFIDASIPMYLLNGLNVYLMIMLFGGLVFVLTIKNYKYIRITYV